MGLTGFLVSDVLLWRILHLIHTLCQSKDYCKCQHIIVQMTATVHWGNKVVVWFIILILEIFGIFSVAHCPVITSISYLLYCKLLAKTKQNNEKHSYTLKVLWVWFGREPFTVSSSFDKDQVPVVQKVDSVIHWITQLVFLILIHWIAIHPVDSAIQLLNNRGLLVNIQGRI